ncbi:hypothetical protein Q7P35_011282 [Cladosporium inversicolor]
MSLSQARSHLKKTSAQAPAHFLSYNTLAALPSTMSTISAKRSAPSDFDDEPEHRDKMSHTDDLAPTLTSELSTWPPAPAQSPSSSPENDDDDHSPTTRSAKRKFERKGAASNPLPSKRARASDGRWLLPTCRGGSTRRRRHVVENSDEDDDDDDDDDNDESSKNAPEESPATPTREPAAKTGEKTGESNDEGESTSSSQKPIKDTDGSGSKDADNSSEPMSSSCKTVNGTDSSSDEMTESAESSEKVTNDSNSTSDATSSVSETSATEQSSEEASEKAAKVETRLKERLPRQISGLLNNSNQCFSNSVIQFVDAALDGHEVDTVLGPVESTAPFTLPDLTKDDGFGSSKRGAKSKLSKLRTSIHDSIKKARKSKKLRALSPRKHLCVLIHRLRQYKDKAQSEKVTGFVFQQILAHGEAGGYREHLDGRSQQDCYEYFVALLDGIKYNSGDESGDEESEQKPAIIDGLFDFKSETASLCSNESCDHKAAVQKETNSAYTISAPKEQATLTDLLEESNVSHLADVKCPKCGGAVQRVTEFTEMADNFVLHINRVDPKDRRKKISTAIELPFQPMDLGGRQFVLNVIIRHKGPTVQAGHYTIDRKRSRDWATEVHGNFSWYHIDDHEIYSIAANKIKDSARNGQCSMLLFKAAETLM